jgi:hypothetical protein
MQSVLFLVRWWGVEGLGQKLGGLQFAIGEDAAELMGDEEVGYFA